MAFVIIILGFIADRVTKLMSIKHLKNGNDITIIKNIFDFQYVENRGAAFGILAGKKYILIILTAIIVLGMIYYLVKYKPESKLLKVSLALIISGALGNIYDRISYNYVVDFIYIHYKDIFTWPNFNIADMLVVAGTILMSLYIIKDVKE